MEFFSNTKLVQYFGLIRDKLVCVALMTGSDYTEGVEIVGPVTALEVLAEFPGEGIKTSGRKKLIEAMPMKLVSKDTNDQAVPMMDVSKDTTNQAMSKMVVKLTN